METKHQELMKTNADLLQSHQRDINEKVRLETTLLDAESHWKQVEAQSQLRIEELSSDKQRLIEDVEKLSQDLVSAQSKVHSQTNELLTVLAQMNLQKDESSAKLDKFRNSFNVD